MKILVVDDSQLETAVLGRYIQRLGGMPYIARTGLDALDIFTRERPDLVLLDVVLPDIDGYEVARRIRAAETDGDWTPILFVTSLTRDEDLAKGIAAGGDDYISKPVSEIVLSAKIRAMYRIVQMRTSLVVLTKKLDVANQELVRLSASDGLTGIPNRRFFDAMLDREWRRARRADKELAMIMCDVDYFKRFNDTYGHLAGDECLRQVAGALTRSLDRGGDTLARYGGEEFALILSDTSLNGAQTVAERARHEVLALGIPHTASDLSQVTISLGVACMKPDESSTEQSLLNAADQALYRAKKNGRNRVCVGGNTAP